MTQSIEDKVTTLKVHFEFASGACRDEGNTKLADHLDKLAELAVRCLRGLEEVIKLKEMWYDTPSYITTSYQAYAVEHIRRALNTILEL